MPGINDNGVGMLATVRRHRSRLQFASIVLAVYVAAHFALALIEAAAR